jgi:hypothetical protein
MPRAVPILCALVLVAGCGGDRPPEPSSAESVDASAVAQTLDDDLAALGRLPPAERAVAELAFGPRLEADLGRCQGTRYENQPTYLLAQWLLVHGDAEAPQRILVLLDRLESLPTPAYRLAGRALRVQALLRQGRGAEARQLAQQLEQEVPQFGAMRWVRFHEQVGRPAPALPGVATGGGEDVGRPLLVAFLPGSDAPSAAWLGTWTAVKGLQVVAVVAGGDLLSAGMAARSWGCPVRWLRPDDPGLPAWNLPSAPIAVLLGPGPNRLVLAVEAQPAAVAAALRP